MSADLYPKEAEDIVIGQVIYEPGCISRAVKILKPDHFYGTSQRIVFEHAMELWRNGVPVDMITLFHALKKSGNLEQIGGAFQLSQWTNRVAQTIHLEHHAAIVREQYGLRVLRDTGTRLSNEVNMSNDPDELITGLNESIVKAGGHDLGADTNAGEVAYAMMNEGKRPRPDKLGIQGVDDMVFVLDDNVIVFTAPSGVGKTAAVMSAVMNLIDVRKPWVVSLEMSARELITRVLCGFAQVEISLALNNNLTAEETDRMAKAANDYADTLARLDIFDEGNLTIDAFKARAEQKVRNEGVRLIAIDYGQLMDADRSQFKNSTEKHEVISRGIKATAKALNVPILLIVQLNKDGDIYGSGQYEKDAHVVLKLEKEKNEDRMKYSVLKNRNGRTGSGHTPCDLRYGLVGRTSLTPVVPVANPDNRIETRVDDIPPF